MVEFLYKCCGAPAGGPHKNDCVFSLRKCRKCGHKHPSHWTCESAASLRAAGGEPRECVPVVQAEEGTSRAAEATPLCAHPATAQTAPTSSGRAPLGLSVALGDGQRAAHAHVVAMGEVKLCMNDLRRVVLEMDEYVNSGSLHDANYNSAVKEIKDWSDRLNRLL